MKNIYCGLPKLDKAQFDKNRPNKNDWKSENETDDD